PLVTGVQTCALPICATPPPSPAGGATWAGVGPEEPALEPWLGVSPGGLWAQVGGADALCDRRDAALALGNGEPAVFGHTSDCLEIGRASWRASGGDA